MLRPKHWHLVPMESHLSIPAEGMHDVRKTNTQRLQPAT